MSGAVIAISRAAPTRPASVESAIVRSASSTMVAVKTAPIAVAEKPRPARYRARITESQPNVNERSARAANSSRPSAVSAIPGPMARVSPPPAARPR